MGDRWRNQRQIMAKYNKVIGEGQIIWEIQLGDHHRVDMQQRGIWIDLRTSSSSEESWWLGNGDEWVSTMKGCLSLRQEARTPMAQHLAVANVGPTSWKDLPLPSVLRYRWGNSSLPVHWLKASQFRLRSHAEHSEQLTLQEAPYKFSTHNNTVVVWFNCSLPIYIMIMDWEQPCTDNS